MLKQSCLNSHTSLSPPDGQRLSSPPPAQSQEDLRGLILEKQRRQSKDQQLIREQLQRQAPVNEAFEACNGIAVAGSEKEPVAAADLTLTTAERLLER
ncbi:hypothetical protein CYMTET_26051 [Cymbomonas tetramitiformis]|uniref:Uncharacterized protein n=1 Tax=Cymbomonas tetramitiformis TaxID=36881 RepID=A0AAE0FSK0_9CHLO|nr:hypothetical protein CYMTET_26051 [Cymbomonas tetramitiformis]